MKGKEDSQDGSDQVAIQNFNKKEIVDILYPSRQSERLEDQLVLSRKKINYSLINYEAVANWDELNRDLLDGKIDCGICYSMIFNHSSFEERAGPLAYQCTLCQTNLICSGCV